MGCFVEADASTAAARASSGSCEGWQTVVYTPTSGCPSTQRRDPISDYCNGESGLGTTTTALTKMTTLQESICLMDWLRGLREIGLDCMSDDGNYDHHPEYCKEETQDYWEWEQELRSKGAAGERAYALCRRAAETAWNEKHGNHWATGEIITKRVHAFTRLTELREKIR